jgi:coenzyme F420-0:L-glutamate ligase / coenzyme F420-1:gamma-L-glutamate ligase
LGATLADMPADSPLDERAWRYLAEHRVAHLATTDPDGRPSVVPICYASDGRAIYSALDQKPKQVAPVALKRVRNLLAHPEVALLVDDYAEDWSQLAYLLVRGHAALLEPGTPDHAAAVALLRAKYAQYRAMAIEAQPIICIRPTRAYLWKGSP